MDSSSLGLGSGDCVVVQIILVLLPMQDVGQTRRGLQELLGREWPMEVMETDNTVKQHSERGLRN